MKKILFLIICIIFSLRTTSAQTYKVIKVKGIVKVNEKRLRPNQKITLKERDRVVFSPATAKVALYSTSRGLAILKAPKKESLKSMIEGKIADYFKLSKKVTGTRAGELCTVLDFQKHFGDRANLILNNEMRLKICDDSFPMDSSTFFIVSYSYEDEEDLIYKKPGYRDDSLLLSKSELYMIDNQQIEEKKVSNMVLSYYNDKNEIEQQICMLNLVFADNEQLKEEVMSLAKIVNENTNNKEDVIAQINTYLSENYGKVDEQELDKWISSNIRW